MAEQTHIEQMLQTNPRYATMDASTLLMERIAVRSDCVQSRTSRADFSEDDPKPPTRIRKW